jgi:hypothetical protein
VDARGVGGGRGPVGSHLASLGFPGASPCRSRHRRVLSPCCLRGPRRW